MVADDVIQEHLRLLSEYIEDLKSEQGISFQQYQDDKKTRRFVEHTIQIAIECCFDIGHRIIAERRLPLPKERREIFDVLSDAGIISKESVPALGKMVGFRNRLVHEYEKIENEFTFGILKKNLDDLYGFGEAIHRYLIAETSNRVNRQQPPENSPDRTVREPRARYTVRKRKPAKRHAR